MWFLLIDWLSFGQSDGEVVCLKLDVQGQRGGRILDVDGQGGWGVLKIGQVSLTPYGYHPLLAICTNLARLHVD